MARRLHMALSRRLRAEPGRRSTANGSVDNESGQEARLWLLGQARSAKYSSPRQQKPASPTYRCGFGASSPLEERPSLAKKTFGPLSGLHRATQEERETLALSPCVRVLQSRPAARTRVPLVFDAQGLGQQERACLQGLWPFDVIAVPNADSSPARFPPPGQTTAHVEAVTNRARAELG